MQTALPRTPKGNFVAGVKYSPETMFQFGHEPPNKGKKFPGTGNEKSFKKGHQPHNTLYDQATRIRTTTQGRSYMFIRISKGKWEFMQKYRWMNEVGPIPKKMVLRCKTSDTLNCEPSNWELITMAENAILNCHKLKRQLICTICGKQYETSSNKSKVCSQECRRVYNLNYMHKWYEKNPKPNKVNRPEISKVKNCVICDSAFFASSNSQKTCSESCRTIMSYQNRKLRTKELQEAKPVLQLPEKHCSKCGQKFAPYRNSSTICTACKSKGPRTVSCIQCGTEFTKYGKGVQILCSDECKRKRKNSLRSKYGFKRKPALPRTVQCRVCNTGFTAVKGSKYCSDTCRQEAKNSQARAIRAVNTTEKQEHIKTITCRFCSKVFEGKARLKYCSDECRAEVKKISNTAHRPPKYKNKSTHSAKPINKKNPKAEKDAVYAMLELNRNAPKHDREVITERKIESPDLSAMKFRVPDPKLRIIRFFETEEKYNQYLKKL